MCFCSLVAFVNGLLFFIQKLKATSGGSSYLSTDLVIMPN